METRNIGYITNTLTPSKLNLYRKNHTEYYSCAGYFPLAANHHIDRTNQEYYLLMLCTEGKGIYRWGNQSYNIEAGDLILCYTGSPVYYASSDEDPWSLYWVHFDLEQDSPFQKLFYQGPVSPDKPVIRCNDLVRLVGSFEKLLHFRDVLADDAEFGLYQSYFVTLVYQCLCIFSEHRQQSNSYVEHAVEYIEQNLSKRISMDELAKASGVSQFYLSRLFRESIGCPPGQYITRRKLDFAATLLQSSNLPIGVIADRAGFENSMYFSNAFRQYTGYTPSQYRKNEKF